jgi:hypothetical protein
MAIRSSIATVANFQERQSTSTYQKACEEIINRGPDECADILGAVVEAIEKKKAKAVAAIIDVLKKGNQRLAGAINQVHAPALPATELPSLEAEYRAAKALSRARYTSENLPENIQEATRTVTDLCAQAHAYALRLLPVLETMANKAVKKPIAKKPVPAKKKEKNVGDFDLNIPSPGEKIPEGSTGDLTEQIQGSEDGESSDSDADFLRDLDLDDLGESNDTPSDGDFKIDLLPKKKP